MRPVGITWVGFVYVFSLGLFLADAIILAPAGMALSPLVGTADLTEFITNNAQSVSSLGNATLNPANQDGPLERVTYFLQGGQAAIWTLLSLLTGSYMFTFLALFGINTFFIVVLQLIFGLVVASTIIYYLTGRGG